MTQSLAVEWGPKHIRANAIAPGPFPTKGAWERLMPEPLSKKIGGGGGASSIPLRRMGEHRELSNLASFLMSDECEYLTGAVIPIDGGQWLNTAGNFGMMTALDDNDWAMIRAAIQGTNQQDRAQRTT
jgi:NAD(P)-dependent dehydrogenase (short-subunit alcohol dehydrogenase family)